MTPKHSQHLAGLLDELVNLIRAYVVLSRAQADALALWVAHTHALRAFETTPFLAVTSPEKRCGKTRLLDVLELVVARPWRTITPSEAVLYRKIEAVMPTLFLDETDAIFNLRNNNTEPLRALLNAGNRRGTAVPRCVGPRQQLVDFNIFCAKALAGIGALPDTVVDRSIVIRMTRKRPNETAVRFRRREALELLAPLQQGLESWAQDAIADLEAARPSVPGVLDDRAEEAWEPLLAIADLAGSHWGERARYAAVELAAPDARDEEAMGSWLLRDIRDAFTAAGVDRLSSAELAAALSAIEESPWGDIRGKPLDARALAKRLKQFAIRPRSVRLDDNTTPKGYLLEQFEDAFARYLAGFECHTATTQAQSQKQTDFERHAEGAEMTRKPASPNGCGGVADKSAEGTERQEERRPIPMLGTPSYGMFVDRAYATGHLTAEELRGLLGLDRLLRRARVGTSS